MKEEVFIMTMLSCICDYATISPILLMYKVDSAIRATFSTCEDIDEDRFVLHVFPIDGDILSPADSAKVMEIVNPYIFRG